MHIKTTHDYFFGQNENHGSAHKLIPLPIKRPERTYLSIKYYVSTFILGSCKSRWGLVALLTLFS